MQSDGRIYSLPQWRVTRWLADAGADIPDDIRLALIRDLFGTLAVFVAGVINTLAVSAAIAMRLPSPPFLAWLVIEIAICLARLIVLVWANRAARLGRRTPTDAHLLLALAWSASVGYGVFVSLTSGDWIVATLACLSAAAMVGGICFRNFGAPRLAASMIVMSLGPCLFGAALVDQPLLYVLFLQGPLYLVAMTAAAFRLNRLLVATMRAERENDRRARHDTLTGLLNRVGLSDSLAARCAKEANGAVLFLDLDDFKTVNDTHGHVAGDRLLKMVAERLRRALRPGDLASRIGGDEFVVLAGARGHDQAIGFGRKLIAAISPAYDLGGGVTVEIGVSVGVAMLPEHGVHLDDLLAAADAALYAAKSAGKSHCCMANSTDNLAALHRMLHEREISETRMDAAA